MIITLADGPFWTEEKHLWLYTTVERVNDFEIKSLLRWHIGISLTESSSTMIHHPS